MTFPILGGNGAVAGYSIDNSLRFNDNDSANLSRTQSASNRKTFTISAWVKRANLVSASNRIFSASSHSGLACLFGFQSDNTFLVLDESISYQLTTTQVFRDVSSWYHFVIAIDTTQSTANDRLKMYVNGNQITSFSTQTNPSQNADSFVNSNCKHTIGSRTQSGGDSEYFDGYIAEFNFIDGQQLTPTSFGEFDEDSGIWKPIEYTGSYGTNGFYLDFENSGSLGTDQSGNGNNFTPTNLASTDQTTDTPTNNFSSFNVLDTGGGTFSEGNTKIVGASSHNASRSTFAINTGKWYWEIKCTNNSSSPAFGIMKTEAKIADQLNAVGSRFYRTDGNKYTDGTSSSYGATFTTGDIIGHALDMDSGTLTFYKNGTSQGTAFTGLTGSTWSPCVKYYADTVEANFGNAPYSISSGNSDENGYGNFEYAPPSGYLALCTQNLATELSPTIDDGSQYFNSILYTGDGNASGARNITGVGFQPDWTWIKERNSVAYHNLFDSNRGAGYVLHSNATDAEGNYTTYFTSFDSDGFTLENNPGSLNGSGDTYVAWNWLAGGTAVSNTNGSITSTVSANTTAGFSIVTYTGNGNASPQTVGHGLGKKCQTVILKTRSVSGESWRVYQDVVSASAGGNLFLNSTGALDTGDPARITATSSSTFTLTGYTSTYNAVNQSGSTYVAYCFAEIEGYSKFGKYTGNGSTDGTFVYTGFRPQWVMVKGATTAQVWSMRDNKRDSYNSAQKAIYANLSDAESDNANNSIDLLSNGFKIRNLFGTENSSGDTYIYMAFAENPFVSSSGVPVVAR